MPGRESASQLVSEIRDLYRRSCDLADRYNDLGTGEDRALVEKCRGGRSRELPELERFDSVFDRQDALARAQREPAVRQRVTLCQGIASAAILPTALWLATAPGGWNWGWMLLSCGGICGLGYGLRVWLILGLIRRSLREQLSARGVPICVECGYDLRGSETGRCPECGTRRTGRTTVDAPTSVPGLVPGREG